VTFSGCLRRDERSGAVAPRHERVCRLRAKAAIGYLPGAVLAELPDEADEPLDFDALVAVLDTLAGDDVCVDVDTA
jgi:hypothetical protein